MNETIQENSKDFTVGSIPRKMFAFMMPILGALILQAMYGAVDLMIVGRFGTTEGISGVTTGSNILNLVTFTVCSLTTGVTVVMGRYLGAGRPEKISSLLGSAMCFFTVISIAVTGLLLAFARPLAVLMQAPREALDSTVTYIRICGAGYIFIVFYNFISSVFRGIGDSRHPLLFVAIACVVNIIGDLVLVAGFHMNVTGAAIATVSAQAVSVVISLWIMFKKKSVLKLHVRDIRFSRDLLGVLEVGSPLALQEFLTSLSFLALCAFINRLGVEASSGYGIAEKVQQFVMLVPSAIMQSMAAVVAQNVGARKEDRAKNAMFFGMIFGAGVGFFIGLGVFFFGDRLAAVFTEDSAVISRAWEFLRGFAPEAVVTCLLFSFMGYFNGHSRALFVMAQGLIQSFLIRLPFSYIMSIRPNASLTYIGLAAPIATVFGILMCLVYYRRMQKYLEAEALSDDLLG